MGLDSLCADVEAYMKHHRFADIEATFAAHYLSKFHHSEFVKAHRVVIAEMGLVAYEGKILRDDKSLHGEFDRARRRRHIIEVRVTILGLGDDLLGQHHHVAVHERLARGGQRRHDDGGQIVAGPDQLDPAEGGDLEPHGRGRGFGLPPWPACFGRIHDGPQFSLLGVPVMRMPAPSMR